MLNIRFSKLSKKFVSKLPTKHQKQVVKKSISLGNDPLPPDSKAMTGFIGYFRVDSGEYRIIYSFSDSEVLIFLIGKRNDDEVYRKLKRLM